MNDRVFHTSEDVIHSEVGDEIVLLHTESDKAYGLDTTAAFVWGLMEDGGKTLGQLASGLTENFDVDLELALTDLNALLEHFSREKLIYAEPAGSALSS